MRQQPWPSCARMRGRQVVFQTAVAVVCRSGPGFAIAARWYR